MSALGERLARQIAATGPMRLSDYIADCLGDPQDGYYTTRDPLGAAGDFTTAPEISQMFGELIGLWLAQMWMQTGRPAPLLLAELGPGRGTLMADILRAARAVPGFADALQVWLVETSPALRKRQRETLAGAVPGDRLHFADAVEALPAGPLFVVANEFFDALPIRQFQRAPGGWAERMVGLEGERLAIGLAPSEQDAELDRRFGAAPEGTIVETSAPGEAVAATLGLRGALLLAVDYGDCQGTGDTFQALRGHAPADPLASPGEADLTAHVGFRWLAEAAPGHRHFFATQGEFLERLGITERARALARAGGGDIVSQHRRLTHPDEMGTLFKTLALVPPGMPDPPGFA